MKVEVSAHEHRTNRDPAYARVYCNRAFVNGDDQTVSQGDVNSEDYIVQVAVTNSSGIATIPSLTGANRIDSTIEAATSRVLSTYTLTLHDSNGNYLETVLDNVKVPETTPTTWANLSVIAGLPSMPYKAQYYNREESDHRYLNGGVALSSDVIYGRTALDTVPASLSAPIAVGVNSPRVTKVLSADYSNSLATAVSQISSTPTLLIIKADTTVSTAVTIPANIYLKFENNAKIIKSGSGTITFQGLGLVDAMSQIAYFSGFSAGNVAWSGSTYPIHVSTEIFDTGNDSSTDRVKMCDLAFANDARVLIHVYARTFTSNAFSGTAMRDGHSVLLKRGEHQNTLNTRNYPAPLGGSDLPAFVIGDNAIFTSEPGAIFYESENDYNTYLVRTKEGAINAHIFGNYFKGQGALQDNGSPGVILMNAVNSSITNNTFDDCASYNATIGGFGVNGVGEHCTIEGNTFIKTMNQVCAVTNGRHWAVRNNTFLLKNGTPTNAYSPLDIEMNSFTDICEDGVVEGNYIDVRENTRSCIAIAVQGAGYGIKRVKVRNNTVVGQDIATASSTSNLSVGLYAVGVDGLVAYGNDIQGSGNGAIKIALCRNARVFNNPVIQSGAAVGVIDAIGCADSEFFANSLRESSDTVTQATNIVEYEAELLVTSSGSTITRLDASDYKFFHHFIGLTVTLNATDYTISGGTFNVNQPTPQTLTTSAPVGTLTVKSVASASDVDTGADTITSNSHGFNNGARLRYTQGATPIGNLTTGTTYFVVNKTANTFQLSETEGGSAINLSSTGTGTQTFTPVMRTKFSSNGYRDNYAPDGITLESTGTSWKDKGTVTINPASINANTISTQTFTLQGARAGNVVFLNPPAALTTGLLVSHSWVSATDTVSIVFNNTTGSPIDEPSAAWNYQLKR